MSTAPVGGGLEDADGRSRGHRAWASAPFDESLQSLAERYSITRCPRVQEEVLRRCWDWAARLGRGVARRSGVDAETIRQVAGIAVCKALARYDPLRGEFEPFARATTAGEVRHFLRAAVWPVHVPRRLQEDYQVAARVRDELAQRLGRDPPASLVADAAGFDRREAPVVMNLRRHPALLPDAEAELASPDGRLDAVPDLVDLVEAVERLAEEERHLIELRFYRSLTQSEIADQLGTNQAKVSRMLATTLLRLRRWLEARE